MNIGIAGAGLVGRVLALNLLQRGHKVTLFDEDTAYGDKAAGITAAGMLAVFAELESAESVIFDHGNRSIALWPGLLEQVGIADAYQQEGSIITAHPQDYNELDHFIDTLQSKVEAASEIKLLDRQTLTELEPDLDQHAKAFFIPHEGQVDAQRFMKASSDYLLAHSDVTWQEETKVTHISDGTITVANESKTFDWVFDSRGLGAQDDISDLRGVRGEVFWLDAPEVNISRPTRMLHPRYKIYIVPRPNNRYVIGATEIESEDKSPMSVRSSLELLSAVYSMHSGFAEARIVNMLTNCRPALRDNLPKIEHGTKMTRINGLYRHGYLLAPAVVEEALNGGLNR
ncbi:FAD-dependent oxidoreductase [Sulfurovum sp. XGS-02]|uniref:FAD-dependent oxidoreductase n=1 Tax=Sulfurovum sp. XGS-02 TaxID=2925411 RepID=UPI00205FA55F|nr:FAD-dependent oxidoreductase [Sulfurovum sp. XGS-02]UPT78000.1 FAD-dependent oxidoreductase [Sulfurovum sp. XGS-02]